MRLQNLLKTGQLDEHTTDAAQVGKMLDSASRSIVPEPGVIATEIVEDLESALEQMRVIAEDLKVEATSELNKRG